MQSVAFMMNKFIPSFLLSAIIFNSSWCTGQDYILGVGEAMTIRASPKAIVRIGSRKILKAIDEGVRVRFIAMAAGDSTLMIGRQLHKVLVVPPAQKPFILSMQNTIKSFMGLRIENENGKVTVAGQLLRFSDWLELAELAQTYQGQYHFRATPIGRVAAQAISHIQSLAKENHWPPFKLVAQPDLIATLPAGTKDLQSEIADALKYFGIEVRLNSSQVDIQPLIRTHVILAEVTKDFSEEFGIDWPSQYSAQIVPRWQSPTNILATLKTMEAKGLGKVLASPVLVCRSGAQASFHAGGEFPIKIISRKERDVIWKKHGVLLNVKPKADYQGSISLEIETEISLLDLANAVDGIPALRTNKVKSHFDITSQKTVALSGLIRQDWGESRAGLAGLSGIPILGPLFGSQKFLNHQTELVVFVTPEITNQSNSDKIEMPKGWTDDSF